MVLLITPETVLSAWWHLAPCKQPQTSDEKTKGCRERYYVMPGLGVHLKFVDINNQKLSVGIWHNEDYINVK
ncbi:Uncharacterised protein [Serratia fonticola]|uniref:EcpB C-terminal domain-containing protein n=1 Tax=Serratia fonticola TaxID=47917 RepID=A0A4V6KNB8_SERFO|nr:Uncharacterised protein [Serratia fonticola]